MAAYFFRQVLELLYADESYRSFPGHVAAFRTLKEQAGETGQLDGLIPLAERALQVIQEESDSTMLALEAGELAWRYVKDVDAAKRLLARAAKHAPTHPVVAEFESTVGKLVEVEGAPAEAAETEAEDEEAAAAKAAEEEAAAAKAAEEEAAAKAAEEEAAAKAAEEEAAAKAAEEEAAAKAAEEAAAKAAEEAAAKAAEEEAAAKAAEEAAAKAAEEEAEAAKAALAEVMEASDESFSDEEAVIIAKAQEAEKKGGKHAIDAWRDAMSKMPGKHFPRERLKQLYIDAGKWSNVADLYKDRIKRSEDDGEKIGLYWELLDLYRERLKQPGLVVTTLSNLEKLIETSGDRESLLKVVEAQQAQFETMKRWPDLIGRISPSG